MKAIWIILFVGAIAGVGVVCSSNGRVEPAPNGIELPAGYKDWRIIAPSYRSDNGTLRVILGNDVAVRAARLKDISPWPDGSILAKLVWEASAHEKWPDALVPMRFVHVEFMIKDSVRFAPTGGWGFARWLGTELRAYGEDEAFVQDCFQCHIPVRDRDYVYTHPAALPLPD